MYGDGADDKATNRDEDADSVCQVEVFAWVVVYVLEAVDSYRDLLGRTDVWPDCI